MRAHVWTADKQETAECFHATAASDDPMPAGYNIAPSTMQPVIRQGRDTGVRELVGMRWGLVGFGSAGPDPKHATFNARVDNLGGAAFGGHLSTNDVAWFQSREFSSGARAST